MHFLKLHNQVNVAQNSVSYAFSSFKATTAFCIVSIVHLLINIFLPCSTTHFKTLQRLYMWIARNIKDFKTFNGYLKNTLCTKSFLISGIWQKHTFQILLHYILITVLTLLVPLKKCCRQKIIFIFTKTFTSIIWRHTFNPQTHPSCWCWD